MRSSERIIELVANNVANISTPGFRRQVSFADVTSSRDSLRGDLPTVNSRIDHRPGKLDSTGGALDFAIAGDGWFQMRSGEALVYSRHGQFRRLDDGRVADARGNVVQQAGGGDLVLDTDAVQVLADGTVIDNERPVARIAVYAAQAGAQMEPISGTTFSVVSDVEEVDQPNIRQGMVEGSNVVLGDEMVTMMAALRQAETGAKLATLYDELAGRAIQTLGQAR